MKAFLSVLSVLTMTACAGDAGHTLRLGAAGYKNERIRYVLKGQKALGDLEVEAQLAEVLVSELWVALDRNDRPTKDATVAFRPLGERFSFDLQAGRRRITGELQPHKPSDFNGFEGFVQTPACMGGSLVDFEVNQEEGGPILYMNFDRLVLSCVDFVEQEVYFRRPTDIAKNEGK